MSQSEEFRGYAKEALRGAEESNTEKDALLDLSLTWALAALLSDRAAKGHINYRESQSCIAQPKVSPLNLCSSCGDDICTSGIA